MTVADFLSRLRKPKAAKCMRPRWPDGGFPVLMFGYGGPMSGGRRHACERCMLSTHSAGRSVDGPCLLQGGEDVSGLPDGAFVDGKPATWMT